MASERMDWALHQVETWNSGDVDAVLDALGPDFEFTPDPSFPDAGTYSGEELRLWMHDWVRTWKENHLEVLEITEGGQAVVLRCNWRLAAPQSGEEVPVSEFSMVLWFQDEDDRASGMAAFFDRELALEASRKGTG